MNKKKLDVKEDTCLGAFFTMELSQALNLNHFESVGLHTWIGEY